MRGFFLLEVRCKFLLLLLLLLLCVCVCVCVCVAVFVCICVCCCCCCVCVCVRVCVFLVALRTLGCRVGRTRRMSVFLCISVCLCEDLTSSHSLIHQDAVSATMTSAEID
jgi:hypothetical protein